MSDNASYPTFQSVQSISARTDGRIMCGRRVLIGLRCGALLYAGVTDRVVNALLAELDGVQGLRGVVVLGATSRPDLIDAALLRPGRLDRCVECGMPGPQQRAAIASALSHDLPMQPGADPGALAAAAEGLNGADIAAALADAQLAAVHHQLEHGGAALYSLLL